MYYATYFSQFHFLTYLQCNGIHVEYLHHNFFFILYTSTCIYINFYISESICTYQYLVTSQKTLLHIK